MPPAKSDRYLHLEFLGDDLTHRSVDGMLAMHYAKDTLPSFLGTFVYIKESESAVLVNLMDGLETTAKAASGKGNQGFAGHWIVMEVDLVGTCFTPSVGAFRNKLCVVLAPRYFLKIADATDKLRQQLAPCKPLENRHSPTSEPDACICTTDSKFKQRSYRFDEYNEDELWVVSTADLHELNKDQNVTAYNGPYDTLQEHRISEYPHAWH